MHNQVNGRVVSCLLVCAAVFVSGCSPEAKFRVNRAQLRLQAIAKELDKQTLSEADRTEAEEEAAAKEEEVDYPTYEFEEQITNIATILVGLFGTPDKPEFPAVSDADGAEIRIVNLERLKMAAGPFGKDADGNPRGLYRQHCAHCHGVTGDGVGPTAAFLNPYPRDYRSGKFKFKSTELGVKPTQADLEKIIGDGIPGTAMPAFNVLLSKPEMAAIIDYVKYLSIRGEVERELIDALVTLQSEQDPPDENSLPDKVKLLDFSQEGEEYEAGIELVGEMVNRIAGSWHEPTASVAPDRPASWYDANGQLEKKVLAEKIAMGRDLFYSARFNCFSCHGDTALGDGGQKFYDDWTKDIFGTPPASAEEEAKFNELREEFAELGVLKPRLLRPRNLRLGVYRGGHRPLDLFYRVTNGIEGTPMPAVKLDVASGETEEEYQERVWTVVEYVRSLPYESISQPPQEHKPVNEKKFR